MDLIGKYLGIWVNRDEIVEIFGLHPASTAKVFIVGGEVIGAIPALGLFMRLDTVAVSGESEDIFPDVAKDRPRRLSEGRYVHPSATLHDREPQRRPPRAARRPDRHRRLQPPHDAQRHQLRHVGRDRASY